MDPMLQLLLQTNLQQQAMTQELAQSLPIATQELLQLKNLIPLPPSIFWTAAEKPSVCSPNSAVMMTSRPSWRLSKLRLLTMRLSRAKSWFAGACHTTNVVA